MSGEGIFGIVIMTVCCFGCGILFYGLGIWSSKRKDPMPFWSNTVIASETIADIPAYNFANAEMWKKYSYPYFLSGGLCLLAPWKELFLAISLIPLCLAGTIGIFWLIRTFRKIEKQYKCNDT